MKEIEKEKMKNLHLSEWKLRVETQQTELNFKAAEIIGTVLGGGNSGKENMYSLKD